MRCLVAGAAMVALLGCGGSNTDINSWLGSYTATGTETESCTSGNNTTPLSGLVAIASFAADTITTEPANFCNLNWNVNGDLATLDGATQTCTVPVSQGGIWHPTFTAGTLTLSGTSISVTDSGTAVLALNGTNVNCTFSQSGLFTRN